ncbi:glycoside hydrolase family 2 sugar binding [Chitinophaga pinensis DSM 2588]|uniref:Glycoside hydrolase family 2 sugar binding n=2 Tax=Chitinophaga pinensis TaxID=79329 RepID=A0A979GM19_CHIPD|nr:glycoside hydrolase family 2 sugar binding [Chitinophaga pinensis DSM 2588]
MNKYCYALIFTIFSFSKYAVNAQVAKTVFLPKCGIPTRWASQVDVEHPLPDYPRPQMQRDNWINLNGLWDYAITNERNVLPDIYSGKILVPFPIESSLSGVRKGLTRSQILWYKRNVKISGIKSDERLLLHFGAVDYKATIYVNGKLIGTHEGGYTSFSLDISHVVKRGDNEIVVKVYDPTDDGINPHGKQSLNPGNIYYTASSGIWQTVWLERVPSSYVSDVTIASDIDSGYVKINVATVDCLGKGDSIKISCSDGTSAIGALKGDMKLLIKSPHLWTPDDPFLYDLNISLIRNNKVIDVVNSYFGMRKISVKKDSTGVDRIFLNNKYVYNLGVLDQGFWPDGLYTAPTDDALKFDIAICKKMGFNTIRKHIKIESDRWYYHADKLGVIVWQDFVNPNVKLLPSAKKAFEDQVEETIKQLYNHPCITTWVLFNEKWGQYDQQRLTRWVKEKDPSRLVNGHSGELLYVNNQLRSPAPDAYIDADLTDIHSYPYPRNAPSLDGKARVLGEYGGIGVSVDGHKWNDLETGWGYDGTISPSAMLSQYEDMMDSIIILERDGLSASIYTQPFDVESEQNGLISYDRQVAKVPLEKLQAINNRILNRISSIGATHENIIIDVMDTTVVSYNVRMDEFKNGRNDSVFLRRLTVEANKRSQLDEVQLIANRYLKGLKNPFAEENLRFITKFTKNVNDTGFSILYNNVNRVNAILGPDEAEACITACIENSEIKPYIDEQKHPEWDEIKKRISRFGPLGKETLLQAQVFYSINLKDYNLFSEVASEWYNTYGKNRKWVTDFLINTMSWYLFLDCKDTSALTIAIAWIQKVVERSPSPDNYDTYANLLYKTGEKDKAIEIQEIAVKLHTGDGNISELITHLEKMKKGEPTWDN